MNSGEEGSEATKGNISIIPNKILHKETLQGNYAQTRSSGRTLAFGRYALLLSTTGSFLLRGSEACHGCNRLELNHTID